MLCLTCFAHCKATSTRLTCGGGGRGGGQLGEGVMGGCHNLIVTLKEPGSLKVKQNVKVHVESVSVTVWRQT